MVKAPSKHGLDRKYRPWRKGKSAKAKTQGSLKHQLRGQERLLAKLVKKQQETTTNDNDDDDDDDDEDLNHQTKTRIQEIQKSIQSLNQQIADKEATEQEREHAKKSHGTRFLERQKLTRMERNARKMQHNANNKSNSGTINEAMERELLKIAMDQIYVAHYPLQKTYRPLFKNGQRWLHHSVSRAGLRQQIVQDLHANKLERVAWISTDQYERIPSRWTVAQEVEIFGYPRINDNAKDPKASSATSQDDRFAMNSKHDALLEAANQLQSELANQENKNEQEESQQTGGTNRSTTDSSSESDDETEKGGAHKMTTGKAGASKRKLDDSGHATSEDSSCDDSSDDSSEDEADHLQSEKLEVKKSLGLGDQRQTVARSGDGDKDDNDSDSDSTNSSSSSNKSESSSSSDSSNDESEEAEVGNQPKQPQKTNQNQKADAGRVDGSKDRNTNNTEGSDSEDDFFVAAAESKDDDIHVFEKAKDKPYHMLPAENPAKGDKSKGWATQKQRPGQFKKKRLRR